MSYELIHTIEMPTPPKGLVGTDDPDPINAPLDANANFRI